MLDNDSATRRPRPIAPAPAAALGRARRGWHRRGRGSADPRGGGRAGAHRFCPAYPLRVFEPIPALGVGLAALLAQACRAPLILGGSSRRSHPGAFSSPPAPRPRAGGPVPRVGRPRPPGVRPRVAGSVRRSHEIDSGSPGGPRGAGPPGGRAKGTRKRPTLVFGARRQRGERPSRPAPLSGRTGPTLAHRRCPDTGVQSGVRRALDRPWLLTDRAPCPILATSAPLPLDFLPEVCAARTDGVALAEPARQSPAPSFDPTSSGSGRRPPSRARKEQRP